MDRGQRTRDKGARTTDKGRGLWTAGRAGLHASVLGLLSFVLPFAAQAAASDYSGWRKSDGTPQSVMLSYYDGPDTRGFAWQTSTSVSSGALWLLGGDFDSANDADFDTNQVATATSTKQTDCYTHKAQVTGLSAGTWSYRLGTVSHYAYGKFTVRDGTTPFVAVNITDIQLKSADKLSNWKNVVTAADAVLGGGANADTIISCGDFFDQTNPSGYSRYVCMGVTADQARPEFADVAWTMASGNHDTSYYKACCAENYNSAATSGGGCHSYDYGKVHVATIPYATSLSSSVESWLKNDLAAAQDAQWRILVMHFGPYTTGDHGYGATSTYVQKVAGLCATYKVDLVLQGHDHTYSKTLPYLWAGKGYASSTTDSTAVNLKPATVVIGGETYYDKPEGTVYVSAGCAGDRVGENASYASTTYKNRSNAIVTDKVNVKSEYANVGDDGSKDVGKPMFAVLTVDDSTLKYDWYVAASATPELFDTLRISKAPPEPPHDEDEAITVAQDGSKTITTIASQEVWNYEITSGEECIFVVCEPNDDFTANFTFTGVEPGTATVVIYQEIDATPLKTVTVTVLPPDPMTTPIRTKLEEQVFTSVGAVVDSTTTPGELIFVYTNTAAPGSLDVPVDAVARILVVGGGAGGVAAKAGKDSSRSTDSRRYTGNGGNSGEAEEFECALPAGQYAITIGKGGSSATPAIESGTTYYDFTGDNPGQPSSIAGPSDFTPLTKNGGTAWATKNDDGSGAKASSKTASKAQDGSSASLTSDITGTETTYAGGGTGGSSSSAERGADATPGTGSGGGGSSGGTEGADSGAGASGIVVVRIARVVEPIDMGGEAYVFERATTENQVIIENASAFEVADGFVLTAAELAKFKLNGVAGATLAAALGGGSYTAGTFVLDESGSPTLQGGTLGFTQSGTVSGVVLDGAFTVDVATGATVTFADILRADGDPITVTGGGRVMFADDVIPETGSPDSSGKLYLCVGDKVTLRFGRSTSSTWTATVGSDDISLDTGSVTGSTANFTVTAQNEKASGVTLTVKRSTQTFTYTVYVLPARRLQVGEVTQHWCNTAISGRTWTLSDVSDGLEARVEKTEDNSCLVSLTAKSLGAKQTVTATAGYANAGTTGALLGVSYVLTTTVYEPVTPVETVFDGRTVTTVGAAVDTTSVPGELILIYTNTEEPGSLEIPEDATARILVVGGGAGGVAAKAGKDGTSARRYTGNGGNSGEAEEFECALPTGQYAITVGAGGSSATPAIESGTSYYDFTGDNPGQPSSVAGPSDFTTLTKNGGTAWATKNDDGSGAKASSKTASKAQDGSSASLTSDITGTETTYAVGGTGGSSSSAERGADATPGTGNGGGGSSGGTEGADSGAGASGIVIVRISGFGEVTPPGPIEPPIEPLVTNKISYVGLEGAANPNPTEFTTNDLPITLSAPGDRDGYTFAGWTPNGGVIPVGTTEDVTFTATWTAVEPPPVDPVTPGGSDANVTLDSIAAGTVTNFTTASADTQWNCVAKRASLAGESASDYVTATVVRNADGTATVTVEILYSIDDKVVVGVYRGSATSGSGTLVKTITFQKLTAEERTRTIAVGETLNESCAFFKERNWACDTTQSGTIVAASVNTASATSTTLVIEGKAEGAATVTVSRTQGGSSKTAMYVYHVTVIAGEPPAEDEQPTDLSPATTAENPIALLTEAQTDYLYTKTIDERRTAAQGGQCAELFCYGSPVVLSWKGTRGECTVTVRKIALDGSVAEAATVREGTVVWTGETSGTSATVYNLELGAGYEWTVTSKTSGLSASATFYTSDLPPRLVRTGQMKNLRDLGGWTGLQGCKIRQNLLFRGAAADVPATGEYLLDGDADREFFYNVVGLRNEVDLRDINSTSDVAYSSKQDGKYMFDPTGEHVAYNNFSIANNELPTNGNIVAALRLLMTPAKQPAYFHCKSGRDRTGIVAAVLLATLGVPRDDIVRDYQTTSDKDNWTTYGFNTILDTTLANYKKDTSLSLADNAKAYLTDCGFSDDEIEDFREALLEGYERQGGETPPGPDDPPAEKDEDVTIDVLPMGSSTNFTTIATATSWTIDLDANANFAVSAVRNADGTATVAVSGTYGDTTSYTATVRGDGAAVMKITVNKVGPKEQDVELAEGGTFTDTCSFRDNRTWTASVAPSGVVTAKMNPSSGSANSTLTITAVKAGTAAVTVRRNSSKGDVDMCVYHVTVTAVEPPPVEPPVDPTGEGEQWKSSYTIGTNETTGVIWCEYDNKDRWWKIDGGDASIAAPVFVDANPNEPKMSGSHTTRAKFSFKSGNVTGTTTWKIYTYTDAGEQAGGRYPGYSTTGGSNNWSDKSGITITITVTGGVTPPVVEPAKFCVTPYLQHPAPDAMTILFFTDQACEATVTCGNQTNTTVGVWAEALTNNLNAGDSSVWNNKLYRHRVRFEGLKANRSYNYTVTLGGAVAGAATVRGETYSDTFRTAPDRNTPIRFVSYADCETTKTPHSNYVKNLTQMKERDPDFITVSGDLVAKGGLQENWDGFWQANAGEKGTIAGSVPVLTVIGNHDLFDNGLSGHASGLYYDMQGEPSTERFLSYFEVESNGVDFANAPAPHTETRDLSQLFHRVDYGPVTLIFLDTNNGDDSDHDKDTNYLDRNDGQHLQGGLDRNKGCRHPDFNVGSPQYVWLTNNLAEAQAKSRFTFVFNHHCPYSRGMHNRSWSTGEDGSALALRFLTETFVRYGVDGWYCGHDELLEHSVTTGDEVLPDGTTRPHTLSIYDLGGSGDPQARNSGTSGVSNPLEYNFLGNYSNGYYGFLETDVAMDAQGRWTCTVTPYSSGSQAHMSDRMIYVEDPERAEGVNDLAYAQHGGISGVSTVDPSAWGWVEWTRPEEGVWDDTVPVTLGSVSAAEATYAGRVLKPNLTVRTSDGRLVPSDHYEVTGWSDEPKNAGTYTAKVVGKVNVEGSADFTFRINLASATVKADDKSKTPGSEDPELTATVSGTLGDDTLSYALVRAEGEGEGEYEISASGDEVQGNYRVTYLPGTFKIAKPTIPLPTTTEADASFSNVPMGTVETVTTTSRADTWECSIESADKDERSICMEASVERNEDGTATVTVNCKYANGTTFTVDVDAVNFAGERKTVKKIKVSKIVAAPAVEIPLTVGDAYSVDCPFGAAEPWKLSTSASGSVVEAQLSSGANESVETTRLSVTARAAGTETVTVIRVNGQYSTDMYVYRFVVKAGPMPFDYLCAAAAAGEAYAIDEDMEFPTNGVLTVPADTSFVLDLRGHAIVAHADGAIVNHGTLTILDSAKASPLAAHLSYSAAELGKGHSLVRSDGELVVDGAFVDAGFVNGADSEFGGGNTAIAATGGRVTVKNGAHVGGRTAIEATGNVVVEVVGSHLAGWRNTVPDASSRRGAVLCLSAGASTVMVSNAMVEAEGSVVSAPATRDASGTVLLVDSVLATSRTTAPFDLNAGVSVSLARSIYVDRMAKWFPVTTALANDGADLKVGAGCLLAVANGGVVGFLDEGVTAAEVAPRVWRTKGADEEALPPLTPEEEAKIAEVLSSSPDALLKTKVTTVKAYTDYKTWVDAGVASGAIESEAAAKGAAGSFFSFATAQNRLVDPAEITEEKVKVKEMKVNGGEVTLTVGIEDLPVGEGAKQEYLEQVFGVTGTGSLDETFAAEKVVYKQDMSRNADGTVSYTVEPKVEDGEARPDQFYFKAKVSK